MKITGYGKGWQEPKAATLAGLFLQRLREPAKTTDYVFALSVAVIVIALLPLGRI